MYTTSLNFIIFLIGNNKMNYNESKFLREERIKGTNNGATLRTRIVKTKKVYKRKKKVCCDED